VQKQRRCGQSCDDVLCARGYRSHSRSVSGSVDDNGLDAGACRGRPQGGVPAARESV
jgi:hypothetical protein